MGRAKVRGYVDVVITHPDYTEEEMERLLQDEKEKSEKLKEWPKM